MEKLIRCQAIARSWLSRRENDEKRAMQQSTFFLTRLSGVQAHARGVLMRKNLEEKQFLYDQSSEWISKVLLSNFVFFLFAYLNLFVLAASARARLPLPQSVS